MLVRADQVDRSWYSGIWEKPQTRSWGPIPIVIERTTSRNQKKCFRAVHDRCLPASLHSLFPYTRVLGDFVCPICVNSRKCFRKDAWSKKGHISAVEDGESSSELFSISHKVPNMWHGTNSRFADLCGYSTWPKHKAAITIDVMPSGAVCQL